MLERVVSNDLEEKASDKILGKAGNAGPPSLHVSVIPNINPNISALFYFVNNAKWESDTSKRSDLLTDNHHSLYDIVSFL